MNETRKYLRFPRATRIEHWVQVITFTTLAITGLVQKFAEVTLSQNIVDLLGGVENVRRIHRIAAVVLMVAVVYHIGTLAYRFFVRRVQPTILPGRGDFQAAWQTIRYGLDRTDSPPQQGRFTFDEKVEYWAFAWGTVIMVITGFMMWNPIATTNWLPGQVIPAAKYAHGAEAILAVLAIIIWHGYNVHLKKLNRSMFTGYLTEDEMVEDHPIELADIKAGLTGRPATPEELKKRQRAFITVYGVIAVVLLAGIYAFVTFEETSIETIVPPEEDVEVFVPLTPTPLPTPLPTEPPPTVAALTWDAGIGALLQERCGACHGGPTGLGGLDLSTYQGALAGGNSGPAVAPGDPETSQVIIVQSQGNHPGQLNGDELALLREWIEAGAPEE